MAIDAVVPRSPDLAELWRIATVGRYRLDWSQRGHDRNLLASLFAKNNFD